MEFSSYQIKIFDFLENDGGDLMVDAVAGSGKCVAPETLVAVNGTLISAKQIFDTYRTSLTRDDDDGMFCVPSQPLYVDSLDALSGQFVRSQVAALYRQYYRGILLHIYLDDGKHIRITPNHKLFDGYQWTNKFDVGDFVSIPQTLSEGNKTFDSLLADFLGWLIAEGYDHQTDLYSFTMRDRENVKHIRDLVDQIEDRYGLPKRIKNIACQKDRNVHIMRFKSVELSNLLKAIGYKMNTLSKGKEIPDSLMGAGNEAVRLFLRAYFDGEGSVHQGRGTIEVSSASWMLIQQVQYLLQRFGIWARFSAMQKSATNGLNIKREYYRLVIGSLSLRQFAKEIGFSLADKQEKLNHVIQKKANPNRELLPSAAILNRLHQRGFGRHALGVPDENYFIKKRLSRKTYLGKVAPALQRLCEETKDHYMLIAETKYELDRVADSSLEYPKIIKIEIEPYDGYVYDFTVEHTHNFVANGILCHNTTTIEHAVLRLMEKSAKSIALIAFNRSIKAELLRRLDGKLSTKEIKTVHGLGWAAINYAMRRKPIVTQNKYRDLAKKWWEESQLIGAIPEAVLEAISDSKETDLAKTLLYDIEGLHRLIRYDLIDIDDSEAVQALCHRRDFYPLFFDLTVDGARYLFKKGWQEFERNSTVDYTDLVYYPASRQDMRPMTFDIVFVDEAQDLSKMALQLILKCRRNGGRLAFVGDPGQAIYAFAGADAASWDNIIEKTTPTALPLSKNYRCPTTVIELAQRLVPHLEAHDGASPGSVRWISQAQGEKEIIDNQANLMILGRLNAPLISLAISFIKRRVAAKVKGRDIGKELITVLETVAKHSEFTYDLMPYFLDSYLQRQIEFLESQGASEMAIQAISDKIEALKTCYADFGCADLPALIKAIDDLFEDLLTPKEFEERFPTLQGKFRYKNQRIIGVRGDQREVTLVLEDTKTVTLTAESLDEQLIMREIVWLSTIHKAKGLEEERIYVVNPEQVPLKYKNQTAAQYQQELNLAYVLITRAKKSLTIMGKFSIDLLNTPLGESTFQKANQLAENLKRDEQIIEKLETTMDAEAIAEFIEEIANK